MCDTTPEERNGKLAQHLADIRFWEPDDRPREELNRYLQVAGLCWATPTVADRVMDPELAIVFARALRACCDMKDRS